MIEVIEETLEEFKIDMDNLGTFEVSNGLIMCTSASEDEAYLLYRAPEWLEWCVKRIRKIEATPEFKSFGYKKSVETIKGLEEKNKIMEEALENISTSVGKAASGNSAKHKATKALERVKEIDA